MGPYLGDFVEDSTLHFLWDTNDANGASITRSTDGEIRVYKDNGITQTIVGITNAEDFDGLTGVHSCTIDLSADAFYAIGSNYTVVLQGSTIDTRVVNAVLAHFSIENRFDEVDVTKLNGVAQSLLDLKDFADDGYDPATNKVQGLVLTDTCTTLTGHTAQTGDSFAQLPTNFSDLSITVTTGRIDVGAWLGTAVTLSATTTKPEVDINSISDDATASNNLELDYDGTGLTRANSTIGTVTALTGHTAQTGDNFARLGAPVAADISADIANVQLDTDNIQTRLLSAITSSTADSGSTTTVVDAIRTEGDTDYWKGCLIRFTSGNISGQTRLITGFNFTTNTITFAPATTQAVVTQNYEIIPFGNVDIRQVLGADINALVSGRMDSSVGAMAANVLTATAINADAITAAKIANAAIDAATFAAGAIDAAAIATDAITNTKIAAGAITSSEAPNLDAAITSRATPAQVNTEVVDVITVDTITLPGQAAPPLTPTLEETLAWLYKNFRNRKTQTATQWSLLADDESTVDSKATVSDDATTAIKQEIVTGP